MNPTQILANQLLNQMKAKNPQIFQQFQNFQKNQNDPQKIIKDMTSKYTPEQVQSFRQYANGFGISNEQLDKFGIK